MAREEKRFLNSHPSAWLSGTLDYDTPEYRHGPLHELDAGFEFYAPQTTLTTDGRRLLVGRMGTPDGEEMAQPTVAHHWIHQMTCLRELSSRNGRLCQQPIAELQALREDGQVYRGRADDLPQIKAQRLELLLES